MLVSVQNGRVWLNVYCQNLALDWLNRIFFGSGAVIELIGRRSRRDRMIVARQFIAWNTFKKGAPSRLVRHSQDGEGGRDGCGPAHQDIRQFAARPGSNNPP